MKTLLILRHAKAESDGSVYDHERELTGRGERQAQEVGRWLRDEGLIPGAIVTSTATRARSTAQLAAAACGYDGDVHATDALYGSVREVEISQMAAALYRLDASDDPVMIVGHNPDLERLLFALTGAHEHLSTASVAQVELDIARWEDLEPTGAHLLRRVRHCPE